MVFQFIVKVRTVAWEPQHMRQRNKAQTIAQVLPYTGTRDRGVVHPAQRGAAFFITTECWL